LNKKSLGRVGSREREGAWGNEKGKNGCGCCEEARRKSWRRKKEKGSSWDTEGKEGASRESIRRVAARGARSRSETEVARPRKRFWKKAGSVYGRAKGGVSGVVGQIGGCIRIISQSRRNSSIRDGT